MFKVLIISRDLKMAGGVTSLVKMISERFSNRINVNNLFVGKGVNSGALFGRVYKTISDSTTLFKKIKCNSYDVIHINPSLDLKSILRDGIFMLLINSIKTNKTLVFFHGWDEKIAYSIQKRKILCLLMQITFGKANKIIVLAGKFSKQLADMGIDKDKIIIFPTMFDGSIFDDIDRQNHQDQTVILFMSRFVARKGMFELLDAFNQIQTNRPNIVLHFVGDGPERKALESKICSLGLQEKVKLLGYLQGKEKAQALMNADIFIFPSYYREGCPISLLEAMAAGLPLITTDVGGIPDIITNGENGILLTSHDPNVIKDNMEKMLENPNQYKEIGAFNKKFAWKNYESRIVTSRLETVYEQIANETNDINPTLKN